MLLVEQVPPPLTVARERKRPERRVRKKPFLHQLPNK
jgi:hypothetical protein